MSGSFSRRRWLHGLLAALAGLLPGAVRAGTPKSTPAPQHPALDLGASCDPGSMVFATYLGGSGTPGPASGVAQVVGPTYACVWRPPSA
jgi:hypothetical protein